MAETKKKELVLPELMAGRIELEEMDWQNAKKVAREAIREAKLSLEMNSLVLEKAEKELRIIWAKLPAEEREKRYAED